MRPCLTLRARPLLHAHPVHCSCLNPRHSCQPRNILASQNSKTSGDFFVVEKVRYEKNDEVADVAKVVTCSCPHQETRLRAANLFSSVKGNELTWGVQLGLFVGLDLFYPPSTFLPPPPPPPPSRYVTFHCRICKQNFRCNTHKQACVRARAHTHTHTQICTHIDIRRHT